MASQQTNTATGAAALILKIWGWRNKLVQGYAILATIALFVLGACGMNSFILEETLQAQGFGYAILTMNREWELAAGALAAEEPYIKANIMALRAQWNPITGKAFKAYADATRRKLERDKSFIKYMVKKEAKARYLAKLGR